MTRHCGGPEQAHPWQDEAHAAAHGGMWRIPYAPRSALGLAALLGYPAARTSRAVVRYPTSDDACRGWAPA